MKKSLSHYSDVLTVKEIQEFLCIGREQAYNLVKSNQFHTVQVGKRILISKYKFESWFLGPNKLK